MTTINDFLSQFTKQKLSKAAKTTVREFEEDKKNNFVCFVDDGKESYDVQITLNSSSEIAQISCDCGGEEFCIHKIALANHISKQDSGKITRTPKIKKVSEAE